jgi:carboxypeptidase C (cathepsin A)
MIRIPRLRHLALVLLLLPPPAAAWAADTGTARPAEAGGLAAVAIPIAVTHHTIELDGRPVAYTAEAGTVPAPAPPEAAKATLFYVAYTADDADPKTRPVSFVFNGGPGAAAAFLHLGALGPKRVVFLADGRTPPPPARLETNPATWLAFTDLVFIDPVGTGYSRAAPGPDAEKTERAFWSRDADLRSLGGFISRYLASHGRWLSPKAIVGESYGGFRAAALADLLPDDFGVAPNAIVMISPALELSMLDNDRYQLMPWVLRLPTMAAGARLHGRWSPPADSSPGAALAEVERFALRDLLPGLAEGAAMAPAAQRRLYAEEARYAGLPEDVVARAAGRITVGRYAKELLRGQTRIVSPYDVSIDTPDPSPGSDSLRGAGSRLTLVSSLLTAAFVSYARSDLQVRTDLPYVVLNNQTNRHWSWSGEGAGRGPVGTADDLAHALVTEPGLVALIAHGVYDLVTPYLASRFLVDQMALDPAARSRIELERYEGGHMFYTHAQALDAFSADVRALFARGVPGAQAGGSEH